MTASLKTWVMLSFGLVNLWTLERQDLGNHYSWANDDTLRRLSGFPPRPRGLAQLESWYAELVKDASQEVYSIKSSEAVPLGWVHLHDIDLRNGTATLGIVLDSEHWGRGYGHDALTAVVIHAFEDLRIARLEAEILAMNRPSMGLFERLGFVHEGTKRQFYYTAGRRLDVHLYGLLATEFVRPRPLSPTKASNTLEGDPEE